MNTNIIFSNPAPDTSISLSLEPEFGQATQLFLRDCKYRGLAPSTVKFYKEHLNRVAIFFEQHCCGLSSVMEKDLRLMIDEMRHQQLSENYMNGRIRTCQAFFKFLQEDGILDTNPAGHLKVMIAHNKMLYTFTENHVRTILSQPDISTFTGLRDYVIMLVMLETGMRVMEITRMRLPDIDFEQQTIRVPMGKGRKPRIVPIQWTCLNQLMTYIRERSELPFDDLWVTISNTPFKLQAIEIMVRQRCKLEGLQGVRGSSHTFRHTMAKFYILNGGDMMTLQAILGHTTLDMTRRYIEMFSTDLQKQHKKYSPLEYVLGTSTTEDESGAVFQ